MEKIKVDEQELYFRMFEHRLKFYHGKIVQALMYKLDFLLLFGELFGMPDFFAVEDRA